MKREYLPNTNTAQKAGAAGTGKTAYLYVFCLHDELALTAGNDGPENVLEMLGHHFEGGLQRIVLFGIQIMDQLSN